MCHLQPCRRIKDPAHVIQLQLIDLTFEGKSIWKKKKGFKRRFTVLVRVSDRPHTPALIVLHVHSALLDENGLLLGYVGAVVLAGPRL